MSGMGMIFYLAHMYGEVFTAMTLISGLVGAYTLVQGINDGKNGGNGAKK